MDYYILASDVESDTKISSCKFYKKTQIVKETDKIIRVHVPDAIKLIKEKDHKIIRRSSKIINDIPHDILFKINGKWEIRNDLELPLLHGQNKLMKEGYHFSINGFFKEGGSYVLR